MAAKLGRQYRSRKRISTVTRKAAPPVASAVIVAVADAFEGADVTFDQAVMLTGFPSTWRVQATFGFDQPVIGAQLLSRSVVRLVLAISPAAVFAVITPRFDPAIRTKSGGFAGSDGRIL